MMSSKNAPAYLIQGKNIILVMDDESHTINKDTHATFTEIVEALGKRDWATVRSLIDTKRSITTYGKGHITIDGDAVYWKGKPFHNALVQRLLVMIKDSIPIEPMINFMDNLMQNPSTRSIDQLYGFLEKNNLPITEDGHFLAFKRVRENFLDIHSGTISNRVGSVVAMDRAKVDEDPDSHCSTGLHFCSESYLDHFGNKSQPVVILKINPADVVSVPTDYDGAKGRCCKYTVVALASDKPGDTFTGVVEANVGKWPIPGDTKQTKGSPADRYMLVRVYDVSRVEYTGLTLKQAEDRMKANIIGKKAKLKMVKI